MARTMARAGGRALSALLFAAARSSCGWSVRRRLAARWRMGALRAPAGNSSGKSAGIDPRFREVIVRSTDGLALGAWWVPVAGSRRASVLAHGRGDSKASAYVLATASVYLRAGFSVLMIDLRGWKWPERRFSTAGYQEARDVLGGLSWLQERGFEARRIVFHGWSTGAAAVVRAAPGTGVAAVIEEGGHADLPLLLGSLIPGKGGPSTLLSFVALAVAGVLCVEFDPFELRPRRDAARLHEEGVPLFIVHSREDRVVPVEHARLLADAHPGAVLWEIAGCCHTAAYTHPEYQARLSDFLKGAVVGRRD